MPFGRCSEKVFNAACVEAREAVRTPLTVLEFSSVVSVLMNTLGDSHTALNPRDLLFMSGKTRRIYPFYLTQIQDKFYLTKVLNRPIRVCGMVKNEGEPGGGPFWVQDEKGRQTLQIVESSQIDVMNEVQNNIVQSATHFNPVDIVCAVFNYKGQKFDLVDFIDHNAAFITEKTKNGKPIKAFELPGLWNGAMAKWTTIFVEVPLITFNPVKTVNDLLKPAHQNH